MIPNTAEWNEQTGYNGRCDDGYSNNRDKDNVVEYNKYNQDGWPHKGDDYFHSAGHSDFIDDGDDNKNYRTKLDSDERKIEENGVEYTNYNRADKFEGVVSRNVSSNHDNDDMHSEIIKITLLTATQWAKERHITKIMEIWMQN